MLQPELQELSWDDIPVATEEDVSIVSQTVELQDSITYSISTLAQEIQVDITDSYSKWVNVERYITTNMAIACLCHSGFVKSTKNMISTDLLKNTNITNIFGFENHDGHVCDQCGGSIENGKCSKCGHAHHH